MERWEYHVIHLNVEGPSGSAQAPASAAARPEPPAVPPPAKPEQVFSKEYLEKEFPGFYGSGGQPNAQEHHPAQQLRGFLNSQGREGWQLLGFFPVGQLLMMIFRRPLVPASASQGAGSAALPPPAAPVPPAAAPSLPTTGALERILERLEALEQRLDAGDRRVRRQPPRAATATPVPPPPGMATLEELEALQDGEILAPERCRELEGHGRLSTAEAARALGFRSAASLLNLAARSGYRPGLVKRGAEGRVAIYVGSERNDRGGRDRRLWVLLGPSQG
ncbi:MAG: hypothetical protein VKJ44_10600 [Synechococcus sp.]|nr:hypothetical protein [Synechococcus sp.]